jgi:hypothetical protein
MIESNNDLVEGLWARLRNVLIAFDRVDRLESASDFVGWVESFQSDDAEIEASTRDWVLCATQVASDPMNYRILRVLSDCDGASVAELMRLTNATRIDVTARLNELAQVGFVMQSVESDSVQGTRASKGMVDMIESLRAQIADRLRAGLTKDNPPPKFHRPQL